VSNIHALERGPAPTQKRHSPYAPIRFVPFDKISKHHKLMLAFDAYVLWKASGQMPIKGMIIHGLQHTTLGLKPDAWIHEVESLVGKLRALLTEGTPPDLVLIEHCSECIFEPCCFYSAYDSMDCPQQKCLIHLMRDLNDDMLKSPYDDELRQIVQQFGELLRPIVDTIDRRGLKMHFLNKHLSDVKRFYKWLLTRQWQSEVAGKCRERFEKNRKKLFTFLNFPQL